MCVTAQMLSPVYFSSLYCIIIINKFLSDEPKELRSVSPRIVNSLFRQYIIDNHPHSSLVFTDGSVTRTSTGYAFHIPSINLQSSNTLPTVVSSFTVECFAILEAIKCISSLPSGFCIIISDSQSCLQTIASNPFHSNCSALILRI